LRKTKNGAASNEVNSAENKPLSQKERARLFHPFTNLSGIGEEELSSLVRRRAQPGILVLNLEGECLYLNDDAEALVEKLMMRVQSPDSKKTGAAGRAKRGTGPAEKKAFPPALPEIILSLYEDAAKQLNGTLQAAGATTNRICIHGGVVYLFRALPLREYFSSGPKQHIMILIERVSQDLRTDQLVEFEKLTPRENEVVHLLLEGKTNKEIAVYIEIGEYTVKDHIKRIMRKHGVNTRAGIVAKVLQSHFAPPTPLV